MTTPMTEQELVEKLRETIKHACKEGTQGWSIFEGLRSDFTESDINQICEVAAEQALSAIRESGPTYEMRKAFWSTYNRYMPGRDNEEAFEAAFTAMFTAAELARKE